MGTSPNTIIYTYLSAGVFYTQTGDTAFGRVQQEALDLGATKLGHKPKAIVLHSIRSAAAMAMIFPVYQITWSCSLGDGNPTPSSLTCKNRWQNLQSW